ncbi:MAG: ABC-F family ATP-binding cassette domain-containing protein [Flavobacteriia bacterium]|nr:ABC-F family ATP-binding cassette domain-containing protein [Flavobacteriia bacterium]
MIQVSQLSVFLPQGYLFKEISFQLNKGEKVALVGKNGAGKSTLLKIIDGSIQASEGILSVPSQCKISLLSQDIHIPFEGSLFNYLYYSNTQLNEIRDKIEYFNQQLVERDDYENQSYLQLLDELNKYNELFNIHEGFQWEEKIAEILVGLGFDKKDFTKNLQIFSGGWKMRAELAKLLVNQPDVLLLDEPTNHLDLQSIIWLENYLIKMDSALILISHDRLFLDRVCNRTLDLSKGKLLDYPYSYSVYKIKRQEELERLESAKKSQEKEIKQSKQLIEKFRAKSSKASFAQSLIKKLEKTELIEVDDDSLSNIKIHFPLSNQPGKWVFELENISKSYGEQNILKNINITVGRGEKIALLGPNGVGKTTLLQIIMKLIPFDGDVKYGHQVVLSYFAQNQSEFLDNKKTILETVDDIAVGEIRKDLRKILGSFLFSGEDVQKKVSVLSGGERNRLALCCLLLSPSNVLILDEPTNHLDMQSKEVLKKALQNYEGTFIIVSHDREFLSGLTNRIWDIEDKTLKIYHDGLEEYLSKKGLSSHNKTVEVKKSNDTLKQNDTYQTRDNREETKNKAKIEKQVKKLEEEINVLENQLSEIENQLTLIDYNDSENYHSMLNKYNEVKNKIDYLYVKWESHLS